MMAATGAVIKAVQNRMLSSLSVVALQRRLAAGHYRISAAGWKAPIPHCDFPPTIRAVTGWGSSRVRHWLARRLLS